VPAPPVLSAEVLLKEKRVESARLEFKSTWDDQTRPAILRTVCAFANDLDNLNGGYIVIGVEDDRGQAILPPRGIAGNKVEDVSKELQGQIKNWIHPEYSPRIAPDLVDDRHVLVIYCPAGASHPYRAPKGPEKGAERVPWVRVGPETKLAQGQLQRRLDEAVERIPFDAQPCHELSARDVSPDLVEDFLTQAKSGLAGDDYPLDEKLRGVGLLQRVNGHEAPLNAALLFFTHEPQQRFRGAKIEIVQVSDDGDKLQERTIAGRLPWLVQEGLAALRALIPTLVRKNDKRAEADRSAAWPFPAVEEALVNAIHHRGYDPANPDPIKVVLYPDRMVITSYPGPMPGITKEQLARGEVAHVRARNRHISELLKDVRLAEARGSGIGKIRRSMERAGNPPPRFEFDEPERTFFEVTLPIHPAHLPEAQALPLRVGTPALAGELVGRQSLLEEIRSELRHHHIALLGPKGRGITSLLNELEANLPEYECHRLNLASVDPRRITGFIEALAHEAFTTPALLLDDVRAETMTSLAPVFSKHPALRVIAAPSDVPDEDGEWWQHFQPLVVPPLDAADARSLAGRLLAGQGVAATTGLADAIAEAAAGLPGIIHRIVQRVSINQALRAPEHIPEVLEELVATRGDPTKLRQRCEAIIGVQSRALDVMADATDTLSPDDLRVALSEWMTPVEARAQLLRLIEAGWLVIRDGRVAFEHPLIRDAWQKSREVDPLEPGDIPS